MIILLSPANVLANDEAIDFKADGSGEIEVTCSLDRNGERIETFSAELPSEYKFHSKFARCEVEATGPVRVTLSDGKGRKSSVALSGGRFIVALQ